VLLLPELLPQRLQALRRRRLVPRGCGHGVAVPVPNESSAPGAPNPPMSSPDSGSGCRWSGRAIRVMMMRASPEV
jgi:hypothetical protein